MRVALTYSSIRWMYRLAAAVVLALGFHAMGWTWVVAILVSPTVIAAAFIVGNRIAFAIDVRRGLARREWTALFGMAHGARRGIKTDFDTTAVKCGRNTDEAILTGYGAILVNLLIARRLGPTPTEQQIKHVVGEMIEPWTYLMRRDPSVLDQLVRASCRYRVDGFPAPSWDNLRGLAAIAGLLGSAPLRRSFRRAVARGYAEASASLSS